MGFRRLHYVKARNSQFLTSNFAIAWTRYSVFPVKLFSIKNCFDLPTQADQTLQPQVWCKDCHRQKPMFCTCVKTLKVDASVRAFQKKYRSCSLPHIIPSAEASQPSSGPTADPPTQHELSRNFSNDWLDRLHDSSLAKRLDFLRDDNSEVLVKGQVFKAVDKEHASLDRGGRKHRAASVGAGA